MGRIKKRIISSDRVKKDKKIKNKIIIAVEGNNKTERMYFNNFDNGKKSYTITVAKGNTTDPITMVKRLYNEVKKAELDLLNGDMAYLIFDTDIDLNKNKMIKEAIEYAKERNIVVITSSPCFELWFLLHYDYTTSNMSNEDLINRLKKYYLKYEKNCDIYEDILNNIDTAILRAKKLENFQIENKKILQMVETNPYTNVYKIVEKLK